jgi:hypothetical protein
MLTRNDGCATSHCCSVGHLDRRPPDRWKPPGRWRGPIAECSNCNHGRRPGCPVDQLVKLPLAIETEVPLGTADVILVELLVEVVGPFSLTTCRR